MLTKLDGMLLGTLVMARDVSGCHNWLRDAVRWWVPGIFLSIQAQDNHDNKEFSDPEV